MRSKRAARSGLKMVFICVLIVCLKGYKVEPQVPPLRYASLPGTPGQAG
jgi:hypothetical protein